MKATRLKFTKKQRLTQVYMQLREIIYKMVPTAQQLKIQIFSLILNFDFTCLQQSYDAILVPRWRHRPRKKIYDKNIAEKKCCFFGCFWSKINFNQCFGIGQTTIVDVLIDKFLKIFCTVNGVACRGKNVKMTFLAVTP